MNINSSNVTYADQPNARNQGVGFYLLNQSSANSPYLLLLIATLLTCSNARAEETDFIPPSNNNISVIDSPSVSGNQGVVTVNVSAGDLNAQANVGVIGVAQEGGITITQGNIEQKIQKIYNQTPDKAVASITGHAFSNSRGWTAINQISGQTNMQANIMVVGIGGEYEVGAVAVDDQLLAQSYSGSGVTTGSPSTDQRPERTATIDDTALRGMMGVVQVNQTAGARNATSNTFVLKITGNALQ